MGWKRWTAALLVVLVGVSIALAILDGGDDQPFDVSEIDTTDIDGSQVFANTCAVCHGRNLRGSETGPPLIDSVYRPSRHPNEAFITAIQLGVRQHHWQFGNMRPTGGLTDAEIAAVILFIRGEQRVAGIE